MHNYEVWFEPPNDTEQVTEIRNRIDDIAHDAAVSSIELETVHLLGKLRVVGAWTALTVDTDARVDSLEQLLAEWDIPHIALLNGDLMHILDSIVNVPDDG